MDELEPNAHTLLDRARVAVSPSGQDVEALAARLGLPPPPGPSGGEPSSAPAANGPGLLRVLLGVGAAAAIAAGVAGLLSAPSPSRLTSSLSSMPPMLPMLPMPEASPETPALAPEPREETPPQAAPVPAVPDAKKAPRKPKPTPEAVPKDDLGAELALILRARRALKAGDDTAARAAARTYASRFPSGSFEDEARALELIAGCNLGHSEDLRRAARARVDEGSAFAQRIRGACLGDP